ncbi:hypothetical protein GWK47_051849 [Chionoecetes opilio]|uniref:Uncharacterized protein n=1 Tax=Chionoecetes opilio TaxID=41210 RepID=A0A8J4YCE3_CHIOP|nr:hypothetical protein GWK47_051849 [Chionoecetes opilio]
MSFLPPALAPYIPVVGPWYPAPLTPWIARETAGPFTQLDQPRCTRDTRGSCVMQPRLPPNACDHLELFPALTTRSQPRIHTSGQDAEQPLRGPVPAGLPRYPTW